VTDEKPDAAGDTAGKEEKAETQVVPILALEPRALTLWFCGLLASRAWVDMGLLAHPVEGKVSRDLEGARLAIDALNALLGVLRGRVDPAETREMERALADLRLNFVKQSAGAPQGGGDAGEGSGQAAAAAGESGAGNRGEESRAGSAGTAASEEE